MKEVYVCVNSGLKLMERLQVALSWRLVEIWHFIKKRNENYKNSFFYEKQKMSKKFM